MTALRTVAVLAYRVALRAFPASHRSAYAADMVDHFEQVFRARCGERGIPAALGFAARATLDIATSGWGERRRRRRLGLPGDRGRPVESLVSDARHASRSLLRSRTLSLVCIVSLGLGLGAVFTISLFLDLLSEVPTGVRTEGLVEVVVAPQGPLRASVGGWAIETFSYPDYVDLHGADVGARFAGWAVADAVVGAVDVAPFDAAAMYATADYFSVLGVVPALGSLLDGDVDGRDYVDPVVVLSHRLWTSRFDASVAIIGRTIAVDRREMTVVGVVPEGFRGHINRRGARQADLWLPLGHHPMLADAAVLPPRDADWLRVVGRLDPGTPVAAADGAVAGVSAVLAERFPATHEHRLGTVLEYTSTGANQSLEMAMISLMFRGLAGLVLVVVCLNIAGMMLVRSATREAELALRKALGASRWRLARYLLTESAVLALAGGVVSVGAVYVATTTLVRWLGGPFPDVWRLTPTKIGWFLLVSLATTALFGLVPALRFSRSRGLTAMNDDTGGGGWRVGRGHRQAAAIQAGAALPFLVLGGLLVHSARVATTADLGFAPEGLYAASLRTSAAGYSEADAEAFIDRARARLAQSPGVRAVAVADGLPLDYEYRRARVQLPGDSASRARAQVTRIDADYLSTLGTALVRGRGIWLQDRSGADRVALISESLATRLFPDRVAVGEQIMVRMGSDVGIALTVVGVTADTATSQIQTARPQIFVPLAQHETSRMYLISRADADPEVMADLYAEIVAELDPGFPRPSLITGPQLVDDSIGDLIEQSTLAGGVSVVALALAALGIYGVIAFMVAARTREIGVRIALGATRRDVLGTVLLDTCKLTVPGLVLGLLPAVFVVRQSGLLWNSPGAAEPIAYLLACSTVLSVALLASLPSAVKGAAVQPIDAIRAE